MYTFCLPANCRERFTEALEELQQMRRDSRLPPPAVFEGLDSLGDNLIIRLVPEFQPSEVVAKVSEYGTLTKYTDNGIPRYQKYIQLETIKSYTGEYTASGLVVHIDGKLYKVPFNLFNELQMKNFFNQIKEFFNIGQVSNSQAKKTQFKPFELEPSYDLSTAFNYCFEQIIFTQYRSKGYAKTYAELSTVDQFLLNNHTLHRYDSEYNEFWQDIETGLSRTNGFEIMAIKLVKSLKNMGTIKKHDLPTYFALINIWARRRVVNKMTLTHIDNNGRYLVKKKYCERINSLSAKNYFVIDGTNTYISVKSGPTLFAGIKFVLNFRDKKLYSYEVLES